jgi:tRNA-2-methylthio-N6-dimethylallyladenosine synthase
LRLIEEVSFSGSFFFKYSPRPGTPAAEMDGQVPEQEKAERLARLKALIDRQQAAFNAACAGRSFDVLFEKPGRHPGQLIGRSPYLQAVNVMAPAGLIGAIRKVDIDGVGANSLFGTLADASPQPVNVLAEIGA